MFARESRGKMDEIYENQFSISIPRVTLTRYLVQRLHLFFWLWTSNRKHIILQSAIVALMFCLCGNRPNALACAIFSRISPTTKQNMNCWKRMLSKTELVATDFPATAALKGNWWWGEQSGTNQVLQLTTSAWTSTSLRLLQLLLSAQELALLLLQTYINRLPKSHWSS